MRGYFGIGVHQPKYHQNIGTLWRSAYQLGASYMFIIGQERYKKQNSDTYCSWKHIPLIRFSDFESFYESIPYSCILVGIETNGAPIINYTHFQREIFLLGSEDNGLPNNILAKCHKIIQIPAIRQHSYNVAVAGSLIMFNRFMQNGKGE